MSLPRNRQLILFLAGGLFVCGGLLTVAWVFQTPSDPGNSLLFGLTAARLALVTALVVPILLVMIALAMAVRDPAWYERVCQWLFSRPRLGAALLVAAALGILLGWTGVFFPPYRAGDLADYLVRLQPALLWLLALSASVLLFVLAERGKLHWADLRAVLHSRTAGIRAGGAILLAILALWLSIGWSGIGIRTNEDYSYGAGAPLLSSQLLFILIAAGLLLWITSVRKVSVRSDAPIFVGVWLIAAAVWSLAPVQPSFFLSGPYPPNGELYPYSDSVLFDVGSQFALIGQGILNRLSIDRALYMVFLFYLHLVAGQDYELLLALQAAAFAVLPALIYLLGTALHSRPAGLLAAAITLLRGLNAIEGSTFIDTAGPKMLLTDFPAALGVTALTLLLIQWMNDPDRKSGHPLWIGGVLGLTIMLRTNALFLLPFVLLLAVLTSGIMSWRKWVQVSLLICLGMLTVTFSWDLRNYSVGSPMFSLYFSRIQSVLEYRYPQPPTPTPEAFSPATVSAGVAPVRLRPSGPQLATQTELDCHSSLACSVVSNFLHSLVTSVMILPTSPMLDTLRYTVKERAPYWLLSWQGALTFPAGLLLALNLLVISLGAGRAWDRRRLAGLAPLVIFLAYGMSNGLARTSGGRYIVPMDWVVALYFAIGAMQLLIWLGILFGARSEPDDLEAARAPRPEPRRPWSRAATLVALLGIGALLPLAEHLHPPRYPSGAPKDTLAALLERDLLQPAGIAGPELKRFLEDPQAKILTGRALYPRYYRGGQGEPNRDYPYLVMPYPRLVFVMLGPAGQNSVLLAGGLPEHVPNGVDVIVLACEEQTYRSTRTVEALAVFVLEPERSFTYLRSPAAPLACPLPAPVCDNNDNCY